MTENPPAARAAAKPVPGRSCEDCSMCCKLPAIPILEKPGGEWCVHCSTRTKCDIYVTRPDPCRSFFCHWMENAGLGPEWRPSIARFMLMAVEGGHTLMVLVDPARPDAWKHPRYYESIKSWTAKCKVVVNVGNKQITL